MYCKRTTAYLLNKHQLRVQLGQNLIIHCFDFIWNKTKHNDAAFWQVLVCLRHKLHHPVYSDVQSSLLELFCTLKRSTIRCLQAFCHKNTRNASKNNQLAPSKDDRLIKHLIICNHQARAVFKSCWHHFSFYCQTFRNHLNKDLAKFAPSVNY